MYSPFIICLSTIFLGERLTLLQLIGALLIIGAVLITTVKKEAKTVERKQLLAGVITGILASACMAIGVIIMKPILGKTPLLWATEVRLIGGIIGLGLILLFYPRRSRIMGSLFNTKKWSYTVSGSFVGAYLAMATWVGGMKYTQASIASALNQTSTIFIFIFAGIILKEPLNLKRTIAIAMAFIGMLLVSFS
jgi:drug/metabolite transporter (DMT)-like permease